MSTSKEFVEYVCEQIHEVGFLRYKKMFGEYMIYVNDKPILLVCDNTVYIKKIRLLGRTYERSTDSNSISRCQRALHS